MAINKIIAGWIESDRSGYWIGEAQTLARTISRKEVESDNPKGTLETLFALFASTELIGKMPLSQNSVYRDILLLGMNSVNWETVSKLYLEKHAYFGL